MSGTKETPRQKMIGMMYLVLTALLALNVSADILDAFAIVNDGLEKTNASVETKIEEYYQTFSQQYDRQPEKVRDYWEKANLIRTKTDEIINYIEKDVKVPLITLTEGITEQELLNNKDPKTALIKDFDKINPNNRRLFYEFELKNIGAKDKYDAATNFMIDKGNATILKEKINEYRNFVISTLESAGITNYSNHVGLLTDVDHNGNKIIYTDNDGKELSWENKNFHHIILTAEIAILNKIVGEIQTTEYDAISELFKEIGSTDYKFNSLTARVMEKSDYVLKGQNYEAEIFIAARDTTKSFDVRYVMGAENFDKATSQPQLINSKDGKVILKFPATKEGINKYAGVVEVPGPDGEMDYYHFNETFTVAPPSATIAPTKMMILYKGIENPISVSAPGMSHENVNVTVSEGTITKGSNPGEYFVKVGSTSSRTVTVTVSAKVDGKNTTLSTYDFRLKKVPDPKPKIGGSITGGKVDKNTIIAAGNVLAVLEDFDFEGYKFTIDSYRVSMNTRGTDFVDKDVKGPVFTEDVIKLIKNAKSGQKISFENIVAKGPDGDLRDLNPIIIQIK